jgi:predicted RecB family nuclease
MKHENGQLLYSATDLAHHLSCQHLTELERKFAEGGLKREHYHDHVLELLIELGERHEQAYLDYLETAGKSVVEIKEFGGQQSVEKTIEAIRSGVDVIAQASLVSLPWRGRADFLIKVDQPSQLGGWSYEVADAKLAQTTRAGTVLQLCLYTEILSALQGAPPAMMYVVRPGDPFEIESLRVADFMAYYRMVKGHFESHIDSGPHDGSYPEPNPHCQICDWWRSCNDTWRGDDHLKFVAGMGKAQIAELDGHAIRTLEAFAAADEPLPAPPKRGSIQTFEKLQRQAQIQVEGRNTGEPKYAFNDIEEQRGFLRLPVPSEGDIFFDIEGYPRAIGDSLEYLLGYVTHDAGNTTYHRLWGLNKREERRAFADFMDFVMQRWAEWPDMHIYHFAPYEPSALKRLATRHAIREAELDQLLRAERLVDLYAVVRQAIRASVESYSIKELERFYGYEREEVLRDASRSLRSVERMIELDLTDQLTPEHREVIERYNKDDCLSTLALRDWLESLRCELELTGQELPRLGAAEGDASDAIQQAAAGVQEVFDRLVADVTEEPEGEDQCARWLLAHTLEYFRREDKCAWWEFFRLHDLEHDELLRERKAITGLQFDRAMPSASGRLPTHRYRFASQEVTVDEGDDLIEVKGEKVGKVVAIDHLNGTVDIKKRGDSVDLHPAAVFAFDYVGPGQMPTSLLDFGIQLTKKPPRSGRYDLLAKHPPRLKSLSLPLNGDQKDAAIRLAFDLDRSYLPIQGPPGAGKTFIGSHMIAALARAGKRVGVTAVSHKVILNMLCAVHDNSKAEGLVCVAHQKSVGADELPEVVDHLANRDESLDALSEGYVVGGTAWLWSHEEMEEELDYLFIDEAGQMSLAMAMAAGRAAKNLVLLGDPQQLEQPQQGTHPEGAGIAALDHVLDGAATMPDTKGLFLRHTWRLHPQICTFTSEQYYDFRLESQPGLEKQEVLGGSPFVGRGLRFVPVVHEVNQNRSHEEVAVIADTLSHILDGNHEWINMKGDRAVVSLNDVLIIAPYNAQVSALKLALPAGARVGTVDKFQGQEAPIVIFSMTSSSVVDAPRGMGFLFSRNRMNVATSRARCLAVLVGSPTLFTPHCDTPQQIRLANGFCRFMELAQTVRLTPAAEELASRRR